MPNKKKLYDALLKILFCLIAIPLTAQINFRKSIPIYSHYKRLFHDVAVSKIYVDGKTWVDAEPLFAPSEINEKYTALNKTDSISLKKFVSENFIHPRTYNINYNEQLTINEYIQQTWNMLFKPALKQMPNKSTLLELPFAFLAPGGRFREMYYWDTYFSMLGLETQGEVEKIEQTVDNFAYLINTYGFIPNGTRVYYLSRSQPPFFSFMIEMLANLKNQDVYKKYLPAMQLEYDYWMDKTLPTKHIININNQILLNRYYDQDTTPREESYAVDYELVSKLKANNKAEIYRHIRSAAESGWDFSTRWFADGKNIATIETTNILPVDLNCLLWKLETILSRAYKIFGNEEKEYVFAELAKKRKAAIEFLFYNPDSKWYEDFNIRTMKHTGQKTLAGMTPLFIGIASPENAKAVVQTLQLYFVKPGGLVSTLVYDAHQQWDAPNAWAPLQWMSVVGLENYGEITLAKTIIENWLKLNESVYYKTKKMMEKYNVLHTNLTAGGGEYPTQDGFGWSNGVFLAMQKKHKNISKK